MTAIVEMPTGPWPPPYSLRLSNRARNAQIKITARHGVEVIIPTRLQKKIQAVDLLNEKKSWVEKHLSTIKIHIPQHIHELQLRSIDQVWQIKYLATTHTNLKHTIAPGITNHTLTLYGPVDNIERTHVWIQKWLKLLAHKHLAPVLEELSALHNLPFNKVTFKSQQTMWGSCNYAKNINLNYKLIFLPLNYVKHIMLHELCHTKYLNHSSRFWGLLNKLDPDTDANNNAMRDADKFVPVDLV